MLELLCLLHRTVNSAMRDPSGRSTAARASNTAVAVMKAGNTAAQSATAATATAVTDLTDADGADDAANDAQYYNNSNSCSRYSSGTANGGAQGYSNGMQ